MFEGTVGGGLWEVGDCGSCQTVKGKINIKVNCRSIGTKGMLKSQL